MVRRRTQEDIMEILNWAREQGAVMVTVDGVKVVWPPPLVGVSQVVEDDYKTNEVSLAKWRNQPPPLGPR